MNKILIWLLAATLVLNFSCNSAGDENDKEKITKKKKTLGDEPMDEEEEVDDSPRNIDKMAAGICNCMANVFDGVGDNAKRILIKAGKSSNPTQTMQNEIAKMDDQEEKQKLGEEFTNLGTLAQDKGIQNCINKLEKKYNVSEEDTKAQKRIVQILEKDGDCSLVAALMNIAVKTKQTTNDE